MEPKVGDYVSLDAKKVGQPRRGGVVRGCSKGLSGTRYEIEWDDGSRSMLFPGAGTLLVEGKKPKVRAKPKAKAKAQVKPKKPATKKKK
jgi:hypothetical protein